MWLVKGECVHETNELLYDACDTVNAVECMWYWKPLVTVIERH